MPAAFASKAQESANAYVTQKKWSLGHNPDGRYVVIGIAGISVSPEHPGFQQARQTAFDKAMLNAKEEIAKYYALEVAQEIVNSYGELGNSGAGDTYDSYADSSSDDSKESKSGGIISKVKLLINAELDERLDAKGIDPKSGLAKEEVAKMLEADKQAPNVDSYDVFRKTIERAAQAEVGALAVSKIFEDSGNIVVVATYSDATKQLASAFNGIGDAPKVRKRKGNLQEWANRLSVADLYSATGVQLTSDEEGNLVLLSYAQATAKRDTALAVKNARSAASANADGFIRSFVGESVAYKSALETIETQEEFEGLGDTVGQLAQSREQRNEVAAKSGALTIPGIVTLRSWSTQDKRSGTSIVGVVKMCSLASAQEANRQREDMEAIGGSAGGSGMSNQTDSSAYGSQSPTSNTCGTSKDEQSTSYSHESMESEDF